MHSRSAFRSVWAGCVQTNLTMPQCWPFAVVADLTDMAMESLKSDNGKTLDAVPAGLGTPNVETILSPVRSLAGVIGTTKVHDLDG